MSDRSKDYIKVTIDLIINDRRITRRSILDSDDPVVGWILEERYLAFVKDNVELFKKVLKRSKLTIGGEG